MSKNNQSASSDVDVVVDEEVRGLESLNLSNRERSKNASLVEDNDVTLWCCETGGQIIKRDDMQKYKIRRMFQLARWNVWDELIVIIQSLPSNFVRDAREGDVVGDDQYTSSTLRVDSDDDDDDVEYDASSTILHVVLQSCSTSDEQSSLLPLQVIETILKTCNELNYQKNSFQQLPLHLAVLYMPYRTDIIQCLMDNSNNPSNLVSQIDEIQQKPIDILCRRILMLEERNKYCHRRHKTLKERQQKELETNQIWETVGIVSKASILISSSSSPSRSVISTDCNDVDSDTTNNKNQRIHNTTTNQRQQQSILISCLLAKDYLPFALTDRAIRRFKDQMLEPNNDDGDLPLHVIAGMSLPQQHRRHEEQTEEHNDDLENDSDSDGDDGDDEEGSDHFDQVLSSCPEAATKRNKQSQTPLMVTIAVGQRKWNSGVYKLLKAHPSGLHDLDLPLQLYPNILERLAQSTTPECQEEQQTIIYEILNSNPELYR